MSFRKPPLSESPPYGRRGEIALPIWLLCVVLEAVMNLLRNGLRRCRTVYRR
jgi:hypothetical protein